ncbi:hypothetical protein BDV98DRAFT_428406 [Pterulicium gracile]|uniref:Uncharacterized protein n=1 Tax=Pterulicium gracile TaxID=1884261 RepID=A0A5C3QM89_9AGAR|nr:hypothetical protein BDV98DRAFT_428406 [Pterula gracilis]
MPTSSSLDLRGKTLRSVQCSTSHPSISLSFTDNSSYHIRVDQYSPSMTSNAVWALVQTPGADPAIERLFSSSTTSQNSAQISEVNWQVIDCTFITMSDKAFQYNVEKSGESKWDENHKALAFKLHPIPSSDAMSVDEPAHKPRWHCIWATKEVYSEETSSSGTGYRQCVSRSYHDVYLHPNPGNPASAPIPPPLSTSNSTPNYAASWGRRQRLQFDSRDTAPPSSSDTQMLPLDDARTPRNSKRSRNRSRSPVKAASSSFVPAPSPSRLNQNGLPQPWNQVGSSPARPIPMTRRGSHAEGPFSRGNSSSFFGIGHSPTPNWGSRPSSPSKLRVDIPWTPSSRREPGSPSRNMLSSSPTPPLRSYKMAAPNWQPALSSTQNMRMRAGPASPVLSIPPQPSFDKLLGPQPLASPSKDDSMFGSDAGSDLSTPSLTHSSNSNSNEWLIVENGAVRTTTIPSDD